MYVVNVHYLDVESIKGSYGDGPDFLMMKRKKTESGML